MKKILFVGEFSEFGSGYSKINKELLQRFHNDGYEVAELALLCRENEEKIKNCPWLVFPNIPSDPKMLDEYNSDGNNIHGKFMFEHALLKFQPDFVFANGDPFMYGYQMNSPLRRYFNWIVTAPVDGLPQHNQWLEIFNNAEGVLTYTKWGKKVLEDYGIKVDGLMPPVASNEYQTLPKEDVETLKKEIGISGYKIIGNIMRNQPRKLFNETLAAFAELCKVNDKVLLYCHTTYPDNGWDLSELLIKHKIITKVLFTYKCKNCQQVFPSFFKDGVTVCPFCDNNLCKMPDGGNKIENSVLNKIVNMFDVYLQLACREGFGIPQIEAASCNIPVVTVNYAGMSDMADSIGAYMVEPQNYTYNYPMYMEEAVVDKKDVLEALLKALNNTKNIKELYEINYGSWDNSYFAVKNIVDNIQSQTWTKQEITLVPEYQEVNLSNEDYVKYLILYVLQDPSKLGSLLHTRLIRDLNYGATCGGFMGDYLMEDSKNVLVSEFNREMAYKICADTKNTFNFWQYELNKIK